MRRTRTAEEEEQEEEQDKQEEEGHGGHGAARQPPHGQLRWRRSVAFHWCKSCHKLSREGGLRGGQATRTPLGWRWRWWRCRGGDGGGAPRRPCLGGGWWWRCAISWRLPRAGRGGCGRCRGRVGNNNCMCSGITRHREVFARQASASMKSPNMTASSTTIAAAAPPGSPGSNPPRSTALRT